MQPVLLAYTDFSATAANSLHYACKLAEKSGYALLLFHHLDMSLGYSGEGLALFAFDEHFKKADDRLQEQLAEVRAAFPQLQIEAELLQNSFAGAIDELRSGRDIRCLVLGAPDDISAYGQLDGDFIQSLLALHIPALVIPSHVSFQKITDAGFACDYRNSYSPSVINALQAFEAVSGARLHVIHIVNYYKKVNEAARASLEQMLEPYQPTYVSIEGDDFTTAIISYAREKEIDMLIVVPQQHGFFDAFFRQRNIARLAKVNQLPVLLLPEG